MSLSFKQLQQKANHSMQKNKLISPFSQFMLGLITAQYANQVDDVLVILDKISNMHQEKAFRDASEQQILFLIFQNLALEGQSSGIRVDNGTPILSQNGSPELLPQRRNDPPQQVLHQKRGPTNYWDQAKKDNFIENKPSSQKAGIHQGQDIDQEDFVEQVKKHQQAERETEELIKKLQEEDRQEQLKLKSQVQDIECEICLEVIGQDDLFTLDNCSHICCKECIRNYLEQAMKDRRVEISCPNGNCKSKLTEYDIGQALGKAKLEEYHKYTLDSFVDTHADLMSWCPTPDCGYAFAFGDQEGDNEFDCPLCKKNYCLNCRVPFHKGQSCKEYQITHTRDANDIKFEKFVKGKKLKMCVKCKFFVEKNQGCDHMTCRCGYEFCYKCGGKYMECECTVKAREELQRRIDEQRRLAQERRQQKAAQKKAQKRGARRS